MDDNYIIRHMGSKDLVEAYRIEQDNYLYPWSYANFANSLDYSDSNYIITNDSGTILGFVMLIIVVDECQITNMAIAKNHHQKGLGYNLLRYVINSLPRIVKKIWLEVKRSNTVAQNLYKKLSFNMIGLRTNYYKINTGYEDAFIFMRKIN